MRQEDRKFEASLCYIVKQRDGGREERRKGGGERRQGHKERHIHTETETERD